MTTTYKTLRVTLARDGRQSLEGPNLTAEFRKMDGEGGWIELKCILRQAGNEVAHGISAGQDEPLKQLCNEALKDALDNYYKDSEMVLEVGE